MAASQSTAAETKGPWTSSQVVREGAGDVLQPRQSLHRAQSEEVCPLSLFFPPCRGPSGTGGQALFWAKSTSQLRIVPSFSKSLFLPSRNCQRPHETTVQLCKVVNLLEGLSLLVPLQEMVGWWLYLPQINEDGGRLRTAPCALSRLLALFGLGARLP